MEYEFKPSFDKTFKKLELNSKKKVMHAVSLLIDFFEIGNKAKGLGLKHLRDDFWEVRVNIKGRIIFALNEETVSFLIVGSHDEIKRFLKSI
jgi:mRNA-degrading endonuclease YafQ of YafQ-DinJ toxin-antitoxin module